MHHRNVCTEVQICGLCANGQVEKSHVSVIGINKIKVFKLNCHVCVDFSLVKLSLQLCYCYVEVQRKSRMNTLLQAAQLRYTKRSKYCIIAKLQYCGILGRSLR